MLEYINHIHIIIGCDFLFIVNLVLIILLVIFLVILKIETVKLSMFCVLKHSYQNKVLLVPSIISVLSNLLLFLIWYLITKNILNLSIIDVFFIFFIKNNYYIFNLIALLLITIGFIAIAVIINSFCYLLVNICYEDIDGTIKINLKEIGKLNSYNNIENSVIKYNYIPKVNILDTLHVSILSFVFFLCSILFLILIGKIISLNFI